MREFKGTKGEWAVKHSKSKPSYNVIGTKLGGKYKIAQVPYVQIESLSEELNNKEIDEAKCNAYLIAAAPEIFKSLTRLLFLHTCEMEGLSSGQPTAADWMKAYDDGVNSILKAVGEGAENG